MPARPPADGERAVERVIEIAPLPAPSRSTAPARASRGPALSGRATRSEAPPAGPLSAGTAMSELGIDASSGGSPAAGGIGTGGEGILGELRHATVFDRLYHAIDDGLEYPTELQTAGIEGDVRVTLVFSPEGKFLRRLSPVIASSPYLRVAVMRVLRRVLAQPVHAAGSLRARAVFFFALAGRARPAAGARGSHLGFYRAGTVDKNPLRLGPFALAVQRSPSHLTGTAPGVVTGVDLDPKWIADQFRRDAGLDPLEAYRRDPDWP